MKPDHNMTARRIEMALAVLRDGPLTTHDLAPKIFLCYGHTWRLLKGMHAAGMIHIIKWPLRCTPRATRVAAYAAGPGKDAPKPATLTPTQKQARSRRKLRADADRYDLARAKDRQRKREQYHGAQRDPLVAAMFGAASAREVLHA